MNSTRGAWVLFVVTAFGTSMVVGQSWRDSSSHERALADEQRRFSLLHWLRDETRLLKTEQVSNAELHDLSFRAAQLEGLRARLAELKESETPKADGVVEDSSAPETVPASSWIYAGHATPRAAIESVLWTASHGDVDHLAELLGFTGDVRTRADAVFARLPAASQQEYGSPERVVATLLAGTFPKNATSMTIVADETSAQDAEISMRVDHSDGGPRTNRFNFRRSPDGWELLVPASVMSGYEKILLGDPHPAEVGVP